MNSFKSFSPKQLLLLNWWSKYSKYNSFDAVICDGAIRSGKSLCMSLSFVFWAFSSFNNQYFAFCGKSVSSISRNVITPLIESLSDIGFSCKLKSSKNILSISYKNISNNFYIFGGKDESSASFIQGVTLAGIMLDEVVLMPRSFVDQAIARCSIPNSKFFFNCNPDSPYHWFYLDWIKSPLSKNALYLHFLMSDNPSLSPSIIKRYASLYSGTFYKRFILGEWVSNSGVVYPMFDHNIHVSSSIPSSFSKYYISCDYGIVNPSSFGLWGFHNNTWFRIREFYFNSKLEQYCKTDSEYYQDILNLACGLPIESIIIDPSASSFIQLIKNIGKFNVILAKNDVLVGIRKVCEALNSKKIIFSSCCHDSIREFNLYSWDQKATTDCVKKLDDHSMDDIRYFVNTIVSPDISRNSDIIAFSISR